MVLKRSIVVLMLGIVCVMPGYCEDAIPQRNIRSVSGKVLQIDWVGSKVTIQVSEPLQNPHNEMILVLPSDAKFFRGTESIGLSDIDEGDDVEVEYYVNAGGEDEVISIIDVNLANQ